MSIVDQLLDVYGNQPEHFEVAVPGKEGDEPIILRFRNLSDYVEVRKLHKKAKSWAKAHLAKRFPPAQAAEYKEFAAQDEEIATMAFLISELSVEPNKMTPLDVLKLTKKAALLVAHIGTSVNEHLTIRSVVTEAEEIDDLGND